MTEEENKAVSSLKEIAQSIYDQIDTGKIPKMTLPLRTKSNIRFDHKAAVWKYGKAMGARSAKKIQVGLALSRNGAKAHYKPPNGFSRPCRQA